MVPEITLPPNSYVADHGGIGNIMDIAFSNVYIYKRGQTLTLALCQGSLEMGPNRSKWFQMGPNGSKLVQIALNSSKKVQIAPNSSS